MKTPLIAKTVATAAIIISAFQTKAQLATASFKTYEEKQKINVDLKISSSVTGFRAGVSLIDSVQNKFRLWISNSAEKKFTITVSGASGYLWSSHFKDAYFNQVFDLSSLDDGEYLIKVNCDKDNFEKRIFLSTNNYTKRELKIE